jgi:hypothetical protein
MRARESSFALSLEELAKGSQTEYGKRVLSIRKLACKGREDKRGI